ncbi:MAG TPA: response regulator [Vicinamibacterales bacterium]|jgi:CheY-like chemotaxis protein
MAHTVLIVDDYPDTLELLELTLRLEGYGTILASTGFDAVRLAQADHPDIVIMDIFLPQMDGIAASLAIKATVGLEHVPIIGYTARTGLPGNDTAVFDAVLPKPCSPDVLLGTLSKLLAGRRPVAAS